MANTAREYSDLPETYANPDDLPEAYASPNEALEVVRKSQDKEVARAREDDAPEFSGTDEDGAALTEQKPSRRRLRIILVAAIALALAIALVIGLGVGLSQSTSGQNSETSHSPEPANNGSTGNETYQSYFSTKGAFNGTDIAATKLVRLDSDGLLQYQNATGFYNTLLLYQHYNGDVRWMQQIAQTQYGGNSNDVVANDAKNNTPIDITVEADDNGIRLRVFYVNHENIAKERYLSIGDPTWHDGNLDYPVANITRATLRVGRYTPPFSVIAAQNDTEDLLRSCAKLFVSASDTEMAELQRCPDGEWNELRIWPSIDAQAPPAYHGWASSKAQVMYLAYVDLDRTVRSYWTDTTPDAVSTAEHPLNNWTAAPDLTISNVDPSAGLTVLNDGVLIGRAANSGPITNWDVTLRAENSSVSPSWTFEPSSGVLGGTIIKALASVNRDPVVLMYQAQGDDIMMASGPIAVGPGNPTAWLIPED